MARKTHCIKCGAELTKETRIAFQHTTGTRYMCAERAVFKLKRYVWLGVTCPGVP